VADDEQRVAERARLVSGAIGLRQGQRQVEGADQVFIGQEIGAGKLRQVLTGADQARV
jgi:hypothetical protein